MDFAWKYFVLGRDKSPLPNCGRCRDAGPEHDREACPCLTCHGFYAATDDLDRLNFVRARHPESHVAVRTGAASGITVLDAEGHGDPSGIDVLDGWETWSGGWPLTPTGLIACTPSGGVHRYYKYVYGVKSRNRVLPGIDIKSDGGYVVVPFQGGDPARRWLLCNDEPAEPAEPDDNLTAWLRSARGRYSNSTGITGHSANYSYDACLRNGCPDGIRDEFFNELVFRCRKAGMTRGEVVTYARTHWHRAAQPPSATWYMPWHHVEYKINRIWQTVAVDDVSDELKVWAMQQSNPSTPHRVGRVTIAPRSGR